MAKLTAMPKGPYVRWMLRMDLEAVLQIDRLCFPNFWEEDTFLHWLRQRNVIGMVIEEGGAIQGFMVYALHKTGLEVLRLAVHPDAHRKGYGSAMVRKLVAKLDTHRRQFVNIDVRERNSTAQRFFKECGFRAVSVLRGEFEDTGEDAYRMEWRIGS